MLNVNCKINNANYYYNRNIIKRVISSVIIYFKNIIIRSILLINFCFRIKNCKS